MLTKKIRHVLKLPVTRSSWLRIISFGDAFEWHKSKPTKPGRLPCFQISLFLTEANFLRLVYNLLHTCIQQIYIEYILNGKCGYPWGVP